MKLHVLVAFEKGVPADDPIVTSSYEEAQERFKGLCEHYSLPLDDPHSDEDDIWWWELECAIRVVRTGSGIMQITGIRSEA